MASNVVRALALFEESARAKLLYGVPAEKTLEVLVMGRLG